MLVSFYLTASPTLAVRRAEPRDLTRSSKDMGCRVPLSKGHSGVDPERRLFEHDNLMKSHTLNEKCR